jgi:hypothetical protein
LRLRPETPSCFSNQPFQTVSVFGCGAISQASLLIKDSDIMKFPKALYDIASVTSAIAVVLIVGLTARGSAQSDEWPDRRHLPIEPYQMVGNVSV